MSRALQWSVLGLVAMLSATAAGAQTPLCRTGFVWREAFAGDRVCVTPETRAQAAADNAAAPDRRENGAYGVDTCIAGYVWRGARDSDHVCVTPAVRSATAEDNQAARGRNASGAPGVPAGPPSAPPVASPSGLPSHGTVTALPPPENERCSSYAYGAVKDFETMQRVAACRIPQDARWNGNRQGHYNWCVGAPPAAVANENRARTDHLKRCGALHSF